MKKIIVTGAAGFIGFHLSKTLLDRGDQVLGIDVMNAYYDPKLKSDRLVQLKEYPNFKFFQIDLADLDALNHIFKTCHPEIVVNLAAQAGVRYSLQNPHAYINSNIVGFTNILEACRHHKIEHLVYASSSSVYGANTSMPFSIHDNVDHPVSLYAATKKANELMAHTYSHLYGLPTTGLRFFTVYGPWGRPDMAMFLFTKAILEGQPIDVFNFGKMRRDFTYIDDIVEGVIRTMDHTAEPNAEWSGADPDPGTSRAPYRIYNIGNNQPVELMHLISTIETALGRVAHKRMLPLQMGDVPATYANVDDLMRDVGFKPETTIEEGVDRFVEWYCDYFKYDLKADLKALTRDDSRDRSMANSTGV
jgi:UDP-glucuronate 4-epimerase